MANIENVKVYFDTQKIEQTNEITDIKILMLKGEKGDTVSAQWGTISGDITSQTDLNNELTAIKGDIQTNASDILSLNTRVGADESSISDIDERVTTNTNNIASLDGRITTNTNNITALDSRVTTVETNMGNYDTRITTNTNDIEELDTRVTTNTENINNKVVDTLEGDETTKAPSVHSVNEALTDINGEITDLKNDDKVIVSSTEPTGTDRKKVWLQHTKNILNPARFKDNTYYNRSESSYSAITNNSFWSTEIQKVSPNTTYYCNYAISELILLNGTTMVAAYDDVTSKTFTTPSNCNGIIMVFYKPVIPFNTEVIVSIEQNIPYEPYVEDKEYILNENDEYEEYTPQNEIYSAEEVRIGTFLDKPLYRIVLPVSDGLVLSYDTWTIIMSDLVHAETILRADVIYGTSGALTPFSARINNSNIELLGYRSTYYTVANSKLILEYTKTTD